MNGIRCTLLLATGLMGILPGAALADKYPDRSDEGLNRVESKRVDALYWLADADLSGYSKFILEDVSVAFRKNWQRDQNRARGPVNRVTADDMARIRETLAAEFRAAFERELQEKGGYQLVNTPGEDVLLLRPAIVDLDVYAPDVMAPGRIRTFTTSAGVMTLRMDLLDAETQSLIGRVIDRRRAREDLNPVSTTNRVTNRAEAARMMRRWAVILREALDDAKAGSAAE